MNLYEKIIKVMETVEYLEKDDEVGKGTKASYKAISDEKVKREIRKAMIENKLVMVRQKIETEVVSREYEVFNEYSKAPNKHENKIQYFTKVKSTYKIINAEKPEEFEYIESIGHGVDSQDKSAGKAMTYASKYALLDTYIVPTGDDPDKIHSNDIEPPVTNTPQKETQGTNYMSKLIEGDIISNEQLKRLQTIVGSYKMTTEHAKEVLKNNGYASSKEIKKKDYDKVVKDIEEAGKIILDIIQKEETNNE